MRFLLSVNDFNWTQIAIIGGVALLLIIFIAIFINKGKYMARYKNFYKKMDKAITKKYNGNLLNEQIINSLVIDQTNTYKSLRSKGKRKVNAYFDYYYKNLPQLVLLKSFTIADKNKTELVILVLDENNKVLYRWDKRRKVSGFKKLCNKYQMLSPIIGYLYELPIHIYENASYRFTNHDNGYSLSYDVVKNLKKVKRKQKPAKMSKAEIKAQAKVDKALEKKNKKAKK
ncbi:MAG: hypothetical protein AB7U79_02145 [Candidatus Izemoplasmatales bacterium]